MSKLTPFCIMHYDNPVANTYYGSINYPTRIKTKTGKELLNCVYSSKNGWKKYDTFYALSPMIRPIPSELKLINATKLNKYPYSTKKVEFAYDPFDINKDTISFMTWTQPVPSTVPLYLHITPFGYSYPSFDINPPSKGKWTQDKLSPIYVLVDPKTYQYSNNQKLPLWDRDVFDKPIFRFISNSDRCIPDINGSALDECFLVTDEDILHKDTNYGPTTILTYIKNLQKNNITFLQKNKTHLIVLSIALLILCSVILIKRS
jgi:hypothetical protein